MRIKQSALLLSMTVLLACGTVLAFAPPGVEPQPEESAPVLPSWKAVAASGLVEALPASQDQQWSRVERGDQLVARTAVRTGRRGRTRP